jgi:hypothetical protein
MDLEKRVRILETAYAGIQADAVRCFANLGVLDKVTELKKKEQLAMGKAQAQRFGIEKAEDVFIQLSKVFNCAAWEIKKEEGGFTAESKACRLCAMAKQMGKASPCHIYCLNPMEGMVKGINNSSVFEVKETLWNGEKCSIKVSE